MLTRSKKVIFNVLHGTKAIHLRDQEFVTGTVADMFSKMRDGGYLLEKDVKGKSMTLRIDIFEVTGPSVSS